MRISDWSSDVCSSDLPSGTTGSNTGGMPSARGIRRCAAARAGPGPPEATSWCSRSALGRVADEGQQRGEAVAAGRRQMLRQPDVGDVVGRRGEDFLRAASRVNAKREVDQARKARESGVWGKR